MGSWSKTPNTERHANAQTRERDKETLIIIIIIKRSKIKQTQKKKLKKSFFKKNNLKCKFINVIIMML